MKAVISVGLLIASNVFMTLAWYGHLKFKEYDWGKNLGLVSIILISWGLAFFEYILQVPANRIGSKELGGPFSLIQLKVIQEAITLIVFTLFTVLFFKHETLKWNHFLAMGLVLVAVYLVFHE